MNMRQKTILTRASIAFAVVALAVGAFVQLPVGVFLLVGVAAGGLMAGFLTIFFRWENKVQAEKAAHFARLEAARKPRRPVFAHVPGPGEPGYDPNYDPDDDKYWRRHYGGDD